MGYSIQRIAKDVQDPAQRAADHALLLSRLAVGLAHEGKNPLHNMVLHLQLMQEKIGATPAEEPASPATDRARRAPYPIDKHLTALRDGIGRVDHLLKAFGEFAVPDHLSPDLAAAAQRAQLLFAYEARRAGVQTSTRGPQSLMVASDSRWLGDLVAHAYLAAIALAFGGGRVTMALELRGAVSVLDVRAEDGLGKGEQADAHLDAARRLAADAACELTIDAPVQGSARLSLTFLHSR